MEDGKKQALLEAASSEFAKVKTLKPWLGFSLLANKSSDEPVRTKDVAPNSPASFAGLVNGEALFSAKGSRVGSIPDFIKIITGMQVGDKIPLDLADSSGTRRTAILIVGSQASNSALVNALVRIVVDGTVQEDDYKILQLKPAVDEYLRKEEEKKKSQTTQSTAFFEIVTNPTPVSPQQSPVSTPSGSQGPRASIKKACNFGFKPHQYKKDTCSVCGQSEAAHGSGGSTSSGTTSGSFFQKEEEEKAKRLKDEEEQRQREKAEEDRRKEREREDEERRRREREDEERRRREKEDEERRRREQEDEDRRRREKEDEDRRRREKEDEDRRRREKDEEENRARQKREEEERERKRKEEEEKARKLKEAQATSSPSTTAQPTTTARKNPKCPFGYKPHPVKKNTCSVCGRPQADHEGGGGTSTPASPVVTPSSSTRDLELEKAKQEKAEQERLEKEREKEKHREREDQERREREKKRTRRT